MDKLQEKAIELLHQITAKLTPLEAYQVLSDIIEQAHLLQDECIKMEYTDFDISEDYEE